MNLEEEKLKLEQEKQSKMDTYSNTYDALLNERQNLVDQQSQLVDQYTQTQTNLANDQLKYQKDLLEQEKNKANESFQKEAKASYTDYQNFINPYGVERETQVQNGLSNTGYSETSKVNAYSTHQNRVAIAQASLKEAQLQYDNEFRKAELANNSTLAELALNQLQQKIELIMSNFEYKDTITQNKLAYQNTIDSEYYGKYQDILNQINYEKEQEEAIRQYQEQMEYKKQQDALTQARWEKEFAYQQEQDKIANNLNWASLNATTQTQAIEKLDEEKLDEEDDMVRDNKTYIGGLSVKQIGNISKDLESIYKNYGSNSSETTKEALREYLQKLFNNGSINKSVFVEFAKKYSL